LAGPRKGGRVSRIQCLTTQLESSVPIVQLSNYPISGGGVCQLWLRPRLASSQAKKSDLRLTDWTFACRLRREPFVWRALTERALEIYSSVSKLPRQGGDCQRPQRRIPGAWFCPFVLVFLCRLPSRSLNHPSNPHFFAFVLQTTRSLHPRECTCYIICGLSPSVR
jgi:hypothetical protein